METVSAGEGKKKGNQVIETVHHVRCTYRGYAAAPAASGRA